ncbi:hypothetical protein ABH916_002302 [Peribacillus frigoritolerans]
MLLAFLKGISKKLGLNSVPFPLRIKKLKIEETDTIKTLLIKGVHHEK